MNQKDAFEQPPQPGWMPEPPGAAELAAPEGHALDPADDDLFGEAPPEHGWPGNAFVWMLYAGGGLSLLRMVYVLATSADLFSWNELLAVIPMSLFPGALMVWVGRMIQQFKLAGWGVAMVILLALLFTSLMVLWGAEDVVSIVLPMVGGGVAILWMCYLWSRRPDFS